LRYSPTQDYSFLLDENHYVYDYVKTEDSLHIYIKSNVANVYKFDCENPDCDCSIFMEDFPFAKASQVHTDALNMLILVTSMFLSNEGANKVLALLGIQVSNDTIQRLYDRIEFVDNPNIEDIGIDDVAIHKEQTYVTTIYD